jgi:hypothetical protein
MAHIIAGRVQRQDQVEALVSRLVESGYPEESISSFYVNPPGQHDTYPLGGDREDSPGAQEATSGSVMGAATGTVIGTAVGAVGMPIAGPASAAAGAALGAYVGSLVGSLSEMKEKGEPEAGDGEVGNEAPVRRAGMMVAVKIPDAAEADVAAILRSSGAEQLERAEGTITGGNWVDFDPLAPPQLIH